MAVDQLCHRAVECIEMHETVQEAAAKMQQHGVGMLVIINKDRIPIGLVTDRDLVTRALAQNIDPSTNIRLVMSSPVGTVYEDDTIENALTRMRSGQFRRLVVIDSHHRLVGVVSLDDILVHLNHEFSTASNLIVAAQQAHVLVAE
jgi:CBS domain-containing protein